MLSTRCCSILLALLFIFVSLLDNSQAIVHQDVVAALGASKVELAKKKKAPVSSTEFTPHKEGSQSTHEKMEENVNRCASKMMEKFVKDIDATNDVNVKGKVQRANFGRKYIFAAKRKVPALTGSTPTQNSLAGSTFCPNV